MNTGSTRHPAPRDKGRHGQAVRVRLPGELEKAAQMACRVLGVSMSDLIRRGIEAKLGAMVPAFAEMAKDESQSANQRLKAMDFLRRCSRASVALHSPRWTVEALRAAEREARQIEREARRRARRAGRPRTNMRLRDDGPARGAPSHHPAGCEETVPDMVHRGGQADQQDPSSAGPTFSSTG